MYKLAELDMRRLFLCKVCGKSLRSLAGRISHERRVHETIHATRSKVLALVHLDQYATQTQIARAVGVSRERVRQILKTEGIAFGRYWGRPKPTCPSCGKPMSYTSKSCRKCWEASRRVILVCEMCGKSFSRKNSDINRAKKHGYKHIWCSKHCQGIWAGKNHGWGSRDMAGSRPDSRKHDWAKILEMYQTHTANEVAAALNMSSSTVYMIVSRSRKYGTYSFRKRASNAPRPNLRKYDWAKVLELYRLHTAKEVAAILGMPHRMVFTIARYSRKYGIGFRKSTRKHDWAKILEMYRTHTTNKIAALLDIPLKTVRQIIYKARKRDGYDYRKRRSYVRRGTGKATANQTAGVM